MIELPSYPSSPESNLDTSQSSQSTDSEGATFCHHGLKIININVNGIKGMDKKAYLHAFIDENKPDIVIGTESKLDSSCKNAEIFPDGYKSNVIRHDRNSNGGGVFIIARDNV